MSTPQSKGGKARAKKLTAKERSEIARKSAQSRWAAVKKLPKATHGSPDNPLMIGDAEIQCYVLEDGRRVISQRGMNAALGRAESGAKSRREPIEMGAGNLPSFLYPRNIRPFISDELAEMASAPIAFRLPSGSAVGHGYPAELLPDVCAAWTQARDAGVLTPRQMKTAEFAQIVMQALAKVGIVALVDEATGFQAERERNALHQLLSAYLVEERLAWAKKFPDEFYKQIYRLRGWKWPVGKAKTPLVGRITNDIVYDRLPQGVLPKLRELNPPDEDTKRRRWKHHQFLSEDVGQPDLRDHILQILPIMKISPDWKTFKRHLNIAFPKPGTQIEMDIDGLD